ncbi:hypothetical protein [Microbulbifer litoralis]|uniref:hypothetical protein n=1 Tax=Microbulbifer litoralis TaxID=2933965 RepID=UPI0020284BD8|nr:hypothetical protein [Microbulbifer sp. GX H0434]
MKASFLAPLFAFTLGFAAAAPAQELELCSSAQPCSVSRAVTVGRETTLPITWRGRARFDRVDIASDMGFFSLGDPAPGERLGLVQHALIKRVTGSPDGQPVPFTLNESLTVPAEVSQRATARGATRLLYIRQFSVNGMPVTGVQTIRLSAPLPDASNSLPEGRAATASGLIVRRLALRFEDGTAAASARRGERLRALATIRYERAGLLEAVWEVATPATTRGQPVFRRLDNVREYLGAGREATLQAPVLPSDEEGLYLLRLRLVQPSFDEQGITLHYQVSGQSTGAPAFVPILHAGKPDMGKVLDGETEFHWRPVSNTHAYQLELYDQPPSALEPTIASEPHTAPAEMASAPITGILLEGDTDHTRLSPTVLHRLLPGRIYYWRVAAINAEGAVVAASPIQSIRTED